MTRIVFPASGLVTALFKDDIVLFLPGKPPGYSGSSLVVSQARCNR
jgi:hypothetical protein